MSVLVDKPIKKYLLSATYVAEYIFVVIMLIVTYKDINSLVLETSYSRYNILVSSYVTI